MPLHLPYISLPITTMKPLSINSQIYHQSNRTPLMTHESPMNYHINYFIEAYFGKYLY